VAGFGDGALHGLDVRMPGFIGEWRLSVGYDAGVMYNYACTTEVSSTPVLWYRNDSVWAAKVSNRTWSKWRSYSALVSHPRLGFRGSVGRPRRRCGQPAPQPRW